MDSLGFLMADFFVVILCLSSAKCCILILRANDLGRTLIVFVHSLAPLLMEIGNR